MDNRAIGSRIKNIRLEKGLTAEEFGRLLDNQASGSLVTRWERGVNRPNKERLENIATLGEVSPYFLLYGEKTDLEKELYEYLLEKTERYISRKDKPLKREFNLFKSGIIEGVIEVFGIKLNLNGVEKYETDATEVETLKQLAPKLIEDYKTYLYKDFKDDHNSKDSAYYPPTLDSYQNFKEDIWQEVFIQLELLSKLDQESIQKLANKLSNIES